MIKTLYRKQGKRRLYLGNYDSQDQSWNIDRDKDKHFFRKLNAWAIDSKTYERLKRQGLKTIKLYDYRNERLHSIDVDQVENNKKYLHFKNYGTQIFIEEKHWQ